MRLLALDKYPRFSLAEFTEDEAPPYAILSHTWGRDSDEVSYKDITDHDGTGYDKPGYDKLHFCAAQAKNDRLGFCWIDTCCIDKTNAAELTESINSMFRWYRNAVKCYVFLADVSTPISEDDRDTQLRNSRWFTRGWTLQELIAPRHVEFFSQQHERLGDRKSLEKQIHEITRISIHALRGEPLSHFALDERMSWAASRTTKRPEDKIYSLLGIFDVHIEAIYGEGEHHASQRLQRELERYSKNHQLSTLFQSQLQLSSANQPKPPAVNSTWIVPFERNSRFTGREPELARLEEMLSSNHSSTAKLGITGLGGVGKTQLAIELLYRFADKQSHDHCLVVWISAVNMESLQQSYLDVARQLGIPGCEDDKADVKRLVQAHLSKEGTGRWLLVFDNADDLDMWIAKAEPGQGSQPLIDYVPKSSQGAVVFTTRDRKIAVKLAQPNVVVVPAMGEDAAAQLLEKCLVDADLTTTSRQDTSALLSQLTYLPLAIVQAAAYINENAISLGGYLSLLAEQEEEVVDLLSENFEDDGRYQNINNPVATTWLISFDQIRRRDQLAADYLSFMACIEPKDIPLSPCLLPPGASRKKETDAIGILTAYSFVNKRAADECLDLHRLVHLATRNWLRKEELLAQSTEQAILRLEEVFPSPEHQNRTIWGKYLAHASYVLESDVAGADLDNKARTSLLWKLGACLYEDGRWNEAEKVLLQLIETEKKVLGPEHLDTLGSIHSLAVIYRYQGRLTEAEELLLQVVTAMTKTLGLEHPSTLLSRNQLAVVYWEQSRLDEAEELEIQVMETRKKVLGLEHPSTMNSMGHLASTYRAQGRLDEAEELQLQVIETDKRILGPEHLDTLSSMNNLAGTYMNKGRWDEAEELVTQVMETRKRVVGLEHPETLASMNNLSYTWKALGKHPEALKLMHECVQLTKRVLGVNHPHFLSSSATLSAWQLEMNADTQLGEA